MNYRTNIPALFMTLAGALVAGCGDSVLPEEEGPREVIRVFGEVELPEEERLRFRIDLGRDGADHAFSFVAGEGEELLIPRGAEYSVDYIEIDDDSVHFGLSSEGGRPLSFGAWNSFPIFVGEMWPEGERADSTYRWDGGACTRQASSDGGVFTDPDVELAYPIRYELPAYPDSLVAANVKGSVRVKLRIGFCGSPLRVTLSRSAHDVLDRMVMDAVMEWDFYPGRFGPTYVTIDEFLSVEFEIDDLGEGRVTLNVGL